MVPINSTSKPTTTQSTHNHESINIKTEIVPTAEIQNVQASGVTSESTASDSSKAKKRKSLRFDDQPTVLESVKALELKKLADEKVSQEKKDKTSEILENEKENEREKEKEKDY